MNSRFREHVEALDLRVDELLRMSSVTACTLPRRLVPRAGIYLFSERGRHLYVGRSNRIRTRLGNHCHPSAHRDMASFAFLLAREATGNLKATYSKKGSRAELMKDPKFNGAFVAAKQRIRKMSVRYVAEDAPLRQALLEIYAHVRPRTKDNDFDTH